MCDGARNPPAVGMVLQAKLPNGDIKIVKYYSVKLKPHMIKWYPCELEAVALGSSIEAFYEFIKQSKNPVIICPDSKPVVDAAKKMEKGNFSLSPRIQTFLNNLSKIKYDIQHISGKSGHNAPGDYQSRNATQCDTEHCQICNFIQETADSVINVKLNTLETNIDKSMVPFLNRQAWIKIQEKDPACKQAKSCLHTGQNPSKKPGKMHNNIRRYVSKAHVANDGLLVIRSSIPMTTNKIEKIVIPNEYTEAIVTQMHLKLQHPAKAQLLSVFNRYFFSTGTQSVIDNLYYSCQLCQATRKIPKDFNEFSNTTTAQHPGTHFGIDVMRRAKQKVVVARDMFSSYVTAMFIEREDSTSLRSAIIALVSPIRSSGQIIVRTDNAKGFESLTMKDKILNDMNIKIELSNSHNKNGNSCVDKAIGELIIEITKIQPNEVPIDIPILVKAVMNLNSRVRRKGNLSASEMLFCRDQLTKTNLHIQDSIISEDQKQTRDYANDKINAKCKATQNLVQKGDLVQLKVNPKKHTVRETFLVTDTKDNDLKVQKMTNLYTQSKAQLRSKEYEFKKSHVLKLSGRITSDTNSFTNSKTMNRKVSMFETNIPHSNWEPIKRSTSESSLYISEDSDTNNANEIDYEENIPNSNPESPVEDIFLNADISDGEENIAYNNPGLHLDEDIIMENIEVQPEQHNAMEILNHEVAMVSIRDVHDADDEMEIPEPEKTKRKRSDTTPHTKGLKTSSKKLKEFWSTKKPLSHRPPRKARTLCLKRLFHEDVEEELRDHQKDIAEEAILSAAIHSPRMTLQTSDSDIEEPINTSDWDEQDIASTPTYFDRAYYDSLIDYPNFSPTKLPTTVEPGRVYNLSKIPPPGSILNSQLLPLASYNQKLETGRVYDLSNLHSPPSRNKQHLQSTPRKFSKAVGKSKLARLRKRLFKH